MNTKHIKNVTKCTRYWKSMKKVAKWNTELNILALERSESMKKIENDNLKCKLRGRAWNRQTERHKKIRRVLLDYKTEIIIIFIVTSQFNKCLESEKKQEKKRKIFCNTIIIKNNKTLSRIELNATLPRLSILYVINNNTQGVKSEKHIRKRDISNSCIVPHKLMELHWEQHIYSWWKTLEDVSL